MSVMLIAVINTNILTELGRAYIVASIDTAVTINITISGRLCFQGTDQCYPFLFLFPR